VPWPVYSETFLRVADKDVNHIYTTPAGYRAVVTSAVAVQFGNVAGTAYVKVGGVYVMAYRFPAASPATYYVQLRAVAYAGQKVEALSANELGHITVSGYLFRESGLLRGEPEHEEDPLERPEPLPAGV
jgi:hypothetical protein